MTIGIILIFIGMLLVLVLVHEWGHFIVAKKAGCKVDEFGFGFPPRLFSKMWHGTLYSLNVFPIGGFVKIEGEDMNNSTSSPTSFAGKSALWRIAILSAGVAMNALLAIVLLSITSFLGAQTAVTKENAHLLTDKGTYIVNVEQNSPAQQAGLKASDQIVQIDQKESPTEADVRNAIREHAGQTLEMVVERSGQRITLSVTPRENPPQGQGALGITPIEIGTQRTPLLLAPWAGIQRTGLMTWSILSQFGTLISKLFHHESVGETLTGPIGIAIYTKEAVSRGISYFLEFAAMISINLAIINILPIPALDGGRIAFVLIEKVAGRKVTASIEQYAHTIGFTVLIALMLFVTLKDIYRYF